MLQSRPHTHKMLTANAAVTCSLNSVSIESGCGLVDLWVVADTPHDTGLRNEFLQRVSERDITGQLH